MDSSSRTKANACGILAILLWSTIVGLIRNVSEGVGPVAGAALISTAGSIFLFSLLGSPKLRAFKPVYLLAGGALFASYEVCLSLALGYATTRAQSIEVSVINYLWPSFTVLLSFLCSGGRLKISLLLGVLLSLLGVTVVISGGSLASLSGMAENIVAHPVSYVLAFVGAILWAVYCVVTNKYANGQNAAALFFALTAVCLWIKWLLGGAESFTISLHSAFYIAMAGAAMGFGYAAWNIGMIRGDINLLATLSYFTPILSALFASLILSSLLPPTFWLGVCAVTAGAIICWLSTKPKRGNKTAK